MIGTYAVKELSNVNNIVSMWFGETDRARQKDRERQREGYMENITRGRGKFDI